MRNVAKGLAGIIALLFLFFGVRYMFAPAGLLESAGLEVVGNTGWATLRGLIGGSFLTFGILIIMHVIVHENHGVMRMVILFLLMTIVGRVVSLAADGGGSDVFRNFVPVTLMLLVSGASLLLFLRSEEA